MTMSSLAQNLVYFRKQNNFTQEELAKRLHISYQAVSKWENGLSLPNVRQLQDIADIFYVSIDTLVGYVPIQKR